MLAVQARACELVADRALMDPAAPRSGRVEVTLRDGRTVSHFTRHAPGTKENPLDTAGVNAKARSLMAPVLGARRTAAVIERVNALESARERARACGAADERRGGGYRVATEARSRGSPASRVGARRRANCEPARPWTPWKEVSIWLRSHMRSREHQLGVSASEPLCQDAVSRPHGRDSQIGLRHSSVEVIAFTESQLGTASGEEDACEDRTFRVDDRSRQTGNYVAGEKGG